MECKPFLEETQKGHRIVRFWHYAYTHWITSMLTRTCSRCVAKQPFLKLPIAINALQLHSAIAKVINDVLFISPNLS